MKRLIKYFAPLALLFVASSCDTVFSEEVMPEQFVPNGEVTLDEAFEALSFGGNQESQEITFYSNDEWKLLSTRSWVSFSEFTGAAGEHTITITVEKSEEDAVREASLTFVVERLRKSISLSQAKGNIISPALRSYDDLEMAAQVLSVEISNNVAFNVEYDFAGADQWIEVDGGSTYFAAPDSLSVQQLNFSVSSNQKFDPRTATITLRNDELEVAESFTVTQIGNIPIVLGDNEFIVVGAAASEQQISSTAAVGFDLSCSEEWLEATNGVYANDLFTFDLTVKAHDDKTQTRTATITLRNEEEDVTRTITVTQDEYNDDAYITVTAPDQMADAIAALELTTKSDYNRLYVTGEGVALSADDLTAIKSTLTGLKHIDISATATTEIPTSQFSARSTLQQFIFPATITSIGESAFATSGLTSVVIPGDSGAAIGYRAFNGCASLASAVIEEGVTEIGYQVFLNNYALEYASIPSTIVSWVQGTDGSNKAFANCTALKSVDIAEGLTTLGAQLFTSCAIEEVYIPSSIDFSLSLNTAGDNKAFGSNANLRKVTFGAIASISNSPFTSCTLLEVVIMPEVVPEGTTLGSSAGGNVTGGLTMYVPAASLSSYTSSSWASKYNIKSIEEYVE